MLVVFLILTYFPLYDRLYFYPHLQRWPNSVSFYDWVLSYYISHLLYPFLCWWTCCFHILVWRGDSTYGFSIFWLLEIVVQWTQVHVSFWIMVFSGYMPNTRMAESIAVLFFIFFYIFHLFSMFSFHIKFQILFKIFHTSYFI